MKIRETLCTYLCPIRANEINVQGVLEFSEYWEFLNKLGCEVLVVDGSPKEVFDNHARNWTNCKHIKVDPQFRFLNGKVNGIMTAVPVASHEKIILADDDVRYTEGDILRMIEGLENFDVVRPQNYFSPLPVWARLDTARILLNRSTFPEGDFPGTFGFRKSIFCAAGAFDGDVLFDNEELVKHLQNFGAKIKFATDFFILRKPPTWNKWLEQRPRQAYEDFVMKKRTAFFLLLLPLHLILLSKRRKKLAGILSLSFAAVVIYKAFKGRRNGAKDYVAVQIPFYAPFWCLERSLSVYLAIYWKLAKGGYPFGDKVIRKGTGEAWKQKTFPEHKRKR